MAFKRLAPADFLPARRVAIVGPPNTFKTTSLLTWPHSLEAPAVVMSYPGEKGWETLPTNRPGLIPLIWEVEDAAKVSPHAVIREVESTTWKAISGADEYKGVQTFAGDGLHKLYYWYYRRRRIDLEGWVASRQNSDDENDRARDLAAYGSPTSGAYADIMLYLSKLLQSPIPYVVITMWEEPEPDEPGSKSTHTFPALPGKLAKHIVGEFGAVVSSEVSLPDPQGRRTGKWQIRPAGKVWGVGIKTDPERAKKLPEKIEQSFPALEALLK